MRALLTACLPFLALLLLVPAMAEERESAEPLSYEFGTGDGEFEEVAPPQINYDDFAGPDPVLEGSAPPVSERPTAAEQRIQEVWEEMGTPPAPGAAPDSPAELGMRSYIEVTIALCVVLGLIVLSLWAVRRFGARTPLLAGGHLGKILGRVHLSPKASLHFVRTGGKVLVIGVTQETVQLVETFDADAFEAAAARTGKATSSEAAGESTPGTPFLDQLREQTDRMRRPEESPAPDDGDGDIANLRGDIERLQRMLRDATRE